jgi:hypothetical protein
LLEKGDMKVNSNIFLYGMKNKLLIPNFDLSNYSKALDVLKWEEKKRNLEI